MHSCSARLISIEMNLKTTDYSSRESLSVGFSLL